MYFTFLNINRWLIIVNIPPHGPDDGSVEPKRYSIDFSINLSFHLDYFVINFSLHSQISVTVFIDNTKEHLWRIHDWEDLVFPTNITVSVRVWVFVVYICREEFICLCLPPDRTWHKVNGPKVDYNGDSNPAGL